MNSANTCSLTPTYSCASPRRSNRPGKALIVDILLCRGRSMAGFVSIVLHHLCGDLLKNAPLLFV
jgi:hypothetical protein